MAKKIKINYSKLVAEHAEMRERLEELEEVFQSDKGELCWNGSGDPIVKKTKPTGVDRAIHAAVASIYLADNSDYRSALWEVIEELDPAMSKLLAKNELAAFELSDSRSR